MGFIDVHAHLDMLEESPEATLQRALEAGVEKIVTIGTEPSDHQLVLDIATKLYPKVYCTLGFHPHHGSQWSSATGDFMRTHASRKEVIALGEMGLDYYYKNSEVKEQKQAFIEQLELASELKLPVEIHTRDAEQDTVEILKSFRGRVSGLIHCFTGSQWLADECLALGFNISISGVVTFKNADSLRATVKTIPLNRLHVETDAPFLAPIPHRGAKNTPAFVVHTAAKVAEIKGISVPELMQATNENARQLFPKIIW